jgi:hypothetical protein
MNGGKPRDLPVDAEENEGKPHLQEPMFLDSNGIPYEI